jgi:hypothetical protein
MNAIFLETIILTYRIDKTKINFFNIAIYIKKTYHENWSVLKVAS